MELWTQSCGKQLMDNARKRPATQLADNGGPDEPTRPEPLLPAYRISEY